MMWVRTANRMTTPSAGKVLHIGLIAAVSKETRRAIALVVAMLASQGAKIRAIALQIVVLVSAVWTQYAAH